MVQQAVVVKGLPFANGQRDLDLAVRQIQVFVVQPVGPAFDDLAGYAAAPLVPGGVSGHVDGLAVDPDMIDPPAHVVVVQKLQVVGIQAALVGVAQRAIHVQHPITPLQVQGLAVVAGLVHGDLYIVDRLPAHDRLHHLIRVFRRISEQMVEHVPMDGRHGHRRHQHQTERRRQGEAEASGPAHGYVLGFQHPLAAFLHHDAVQGLIHSVVEGFRRFGNIFFDQPLHFLFFHKASSSPSCLSRRLSCFLARVIRDLIVVTGTENMDARSFISKPPR